MIYENIKSVGMADTNVDMAERTFSGYASTWDIDQQNDIIEKGAFTKTIAERLPTKKIKILWQHSEAIGIPLEMTQDDKGLFVVGKISKTRLGDEALELMRDGVIDRMSVRFNIPNGKASTDHAGVRRIKEVKLLEFSLVTFPANENATIEAVKQLTIALQNNKVVDGDLMQHIQQLKSLLSTLEPLSTQSDIEPIAINALKSINQLLKG
jgi:HK97 family phage prohead protease